MSTPTTERGAITRVIRMFKIVDVVPENVFNGEDRVNLKGMNETEVLAELFQTDREWLTFTDGRGGRIVLDLVYGNEPFEVVSSWGPAVGPLNDLLEAEVGSWDV